MTNPTFPFPAVGAWTVEIAGAAQGEPRRVPPRSRIEIAEAAEGWAVTVRLPGGGKQHHFPCRVRDGDGLESVPAGEGEAGPRDVLRLRALPGNPPLLVGLWLRRDGRGDTPLEVWSSEEDDREDDERGASGDP